MKKWTKGFLVFGVTASILGTCAMVAGAATGGVEEILTLSNRAVYNPSQEHQTIKQDVEKLDISLKSHSVKVVESPDDQPHITYYKQLTGQIGFVSEIKNGTLTIRDQEIKPNEKIGNSLDLLMRVSEGITNRFSEIEIALPKGTNLKDARIKIEKYGNLVHLNQIQTDNLELETVTYDTSIYHSQIKKGTIRTIGVLYVVDSQLAEMTIKSESFVNLDNNSFSGKNEIESAQHAELWLSQDNLKGLYYKLTSEMGIYETQQSKHYSYQSENETEHGKAYEVGDPASKDQLEVKSLNGPVYLHIFEEE